MTNKGQIFSIIFLCSFALGGTYSFLKFSGPRLDVAVISPEVLDKGGKNKKSLESKDLGKLSMVFVGDIMLSRSVGDKMAILKDYTFPFLKISDYINSFDLAFANLENPVSLRGTKVGSIYSFRADPRVIEGLRFAGFDVLSIANNHIWDYGIDAFLDTMTLVKAGGMDYVGGGYNFNDAHKPLVREINGVKISFLAYTNLLPPSTTATEFSEGVSFLEMNQVLLDITEAKKVSDIAVVSFHWGEEYQKNHNLNQEFIANKSIKAGADLIIGHHPHVPQEVESQSTAWIAYSLGNFIFDQSWSEETKKGLALEVSVEDKKIKDVKSRDINISDEYQASLVN